MVTVPSERVGITNGLLLRFPQLHSVGELALLDRPRVAIVGARKATLEGRRRAAQLARDCARAGVVVVSRLQVGHPIFIAAGMLENPKLSWPKRFLGDHQPLGRVLRKSSEVIEYLTTI